MTQTELEHLTVKSTLYTLNTCPSSPKFGPFRSTTSCFTEPPAMLPDCIHTFILDLTSVECVTKGISSLLCNTNLDVLNMDSKLIRTDAECIA